MLGSARLDDLLDLLSQELEARPRVLREALADHDLDRAAAEAHSLKGAAANLGAIEVARSVAALEVALAAAAAGDRTGLAPSLRQLTQAVEATRQKLAARGPRQRLAMGA